MSIYFGNKKVSPLIVQDKQQINTEVQLALAGGNQEVIAPNNYLYYKVTIIKPATLVSNNVRKGVTIAGVVGTMEEQKEEEEKTINISANNTYTVIPADGKTLSKVTAVVTVSPTLQSKSVTPSTTQQIVKPDNGYQGLSQVIVYQAPLETRTITPTKDSRIIQPSVGNIGFSNVTIEAIPDDYIIPTGTIQITENGTYNVVEKANVNVNVSGIDTSDATAVASDILSGKTAYAKGSKITGTIATYDGSFEIIVPVKALADSSWAEISAASADGTANTKWAVGDEKTITLTTGEQVTLQILGFNHDDLANGSGKAGITFGMKNLLATRYYMKFNGTNTGGWNSSNMRTSTMVTLLSKLPNDLRSVIKPVSKKATNGDKSTTVTVSTDSLFLFANVELNGTTGNGYVNEGTQYEYWTTRNTDADRIKKLSNGNGAIDNWWLRSPDVGYARYFGTVLEDGVIDSRIAGNEQGVCFGFCV